MCRPVCHSETGEEERQYREGHDLLPARREKPHYPVRISPNKMPLERAPRIMIGGLR